MNLRALGLLLGVLAGCMPSESPAIKLSNDANDVAIAARFGRMDIVLDTVRAESREAYLEAHAGWGSKIRILDLEYQGSRIVGPNKAVVMMTVSWQRMDESILRSTALKQTWIHDEKRWAIDSEKRVGGDLGLIIEPDDVVDEPVADKSDPGSEEAPKPKPKRPQEAEAAALSEEEISFENLSKMGL